MNHWAGSYERRRIAAQVQANKMADLVSEGWTVTAAGRELGVSQQRSSQIWRVIREGLGPQAI